MDFINHMLKKHREVVIVLIAGALILVAYLSVNIQAAPPGSQYDAAETLDPNCTPGSANCSVGIFPDQATNAGEFLTTDGSDVSWAAVVPSLTANHIGFGNGSNQLSGSSNFTFTNSTNKALAILNTTATAQSFITMNNGSILSGLGLQGSTFPLTFGGTNISNANLTYLSAGGLGDRPLIIAALPAVISVGLNSTDKSYRFDNTGLRIATNASANTTSSASLEVNGTFKYVDGSQGVGKVLTSDANGLASWAAAGGGGGWSLTGNAGTVAGTNFLGTTDDIPLVFKVNGTQSGRLESDNDTANTSIGYQSLDSVTTGSSNTAFGIGALTSNTTGSGNVAIGIFAMQDNTTEGDNTAVGTAALANNTGGNNNAAFGSFTLNANTTGGANTAFGSEALSLHTSGDNNTVVGRAALYNNLTGTGNTALGFEAGYNALGTGNIFIGRQAGRTNGTGSNELWIDNADDARPLIFGDFSTAEGEVGIGTASPESLFHVASSATGDGVEIARFTWDTVSNDDDAHILLYAPNAGRGGTLGFRNNAGSSVTGIFLGDVNGDPQLFVSETGDVGIGDVSPASKLSIPSLSATPIGTNATPAMVCIDDDGGFWKDNDGTFDCQ